MHNLSARQRITPAGAGKTNCRNKGLSGNRDHPRRCGENTCYKVDVAIPSGSPPQVRGKHAVRVARAFQPGITPAGAGKTSSGSFFCPRYWDHPRRCGENRPRLPTVPKAGGSPPQVRGKPRWSSGVDAARRITPAGAGKTLKRSFRNQPFCS